MKKALVLLLAGLLLSTAAQAQDEEEKTAATSNLLRNGDMNAGAAGWQGDRTATTDGENKVIALVAQKSKARTFSQEFVTHRAKDMNLSFKYKTADYKGRGLKMSMVYENQTWYSDMALKADNEWHEVSWKFSEANGKPKLKLQLTLKEGEGTVLFDDIVAENAK